METEIEIGILDKNWNKDFVLPIVDITAWLDNRLSCDRDPRRPPGPRFDRSNFVTDLVRFSGFDLQIKKIQSDDRHKKNNRNWKKWNHTDLFEKKFVNRDVECDSFCFCPSIGVAGAEPRRHAFSYDVSERKQIEKKINYRCIRNT